MDSIEEKNGVTTIILPDAVKEQFTDYIMTHREELGNPYHTYDRIRNRLAETLIGILKNSKEESAFKLLSMIGEAVEKGKLPPALVIRNGVKEAPENIVPLVIENTKNLDLNYAKREELRGKKGFATEFFELALAGAFGKRLHAEPGEHGGHFFQITAPHIGEDHQVSTSSVAINTHNEWGFNVPDELVGASKEEIKKYLIARNVDVKALARIEIEGESLGFQGNTYDQLLDETTERISAVSDRPNLSGLMLGAVVNKRTPTSIFPPEVLQAELIRHGITQAEIEQLATINFMVPVSLNTGDHDMSHICYVGPAFTLDDRGEIQRMKLSPAPDMYYVGSDDNEKALAERFKTALTQIKGVPILLKPGDYVLINDRTTAHARDGLDPADFRDHIGGNTKNVRRLVRTQWADPKPDGKDAARWRDFVQAEIASAAIPRTR